MSPLSRLTPKYSVAFDAANDAMVFHHSAGWDTPETHLQFQVETQSAREPSSLLLLARD